VLLFSGACLADSGAQVFYVDPSHGDDSSSGDIDAPFQTLQKALALVGTRVCRGVVSDKIFLRQGVYRNNLDQTIFSLNLKGTAEDYAMISAMPCTPDTPGAVQRKSGQWYERVLFDDAYRISTRWERLVGNPNIWVTKPGYHRAAWRKKSPGNRWSYIYSVRFIEHAEKPKEDLFTLAPYMLLQDGEPLLWADRLEQMKGPGIRGYDQEEDRLYIWPRRNKNPNTCVIETWYGGPDDERKELRHGEGRAFFNGNMKYACIRGIEFRMFIRLFEFSRRPYKHASEIVNQHHVRFEDNLCRYGWQHLILDGNIVNSKDPKVLGPLFKHRSHWHARNNVMFRPSKESFQVHGENHIFENNEIIEHGGPWAGPAAMVSSVNTRNMRNVTVRNNFILGQGTSPWRAGSVFMIETGGGHADARGDYIYGTQTFENNLFALITKGTAIVAGKGGVRMHNVTIRNNVFMGNQGSEAIRIASPHTNLRIENNVFYDQRFPIAIVDNPREKRMVYETLPSSVRIRHNIFMNDRETIDRRFFAAPAGSDIIIDSNLFHRNQGPAVGTGVVQGDPRFRNPAAFDFGLKQGSAAIIDSAVLGPHGPGKDVPSHLAWWRIKNNPWPQASLLLSGLKER